MLHTWQRHDAGGKLPFRRRRLGKEPICVQERERWVERERERETYTHTQAVHMWMEGYMSLSRSLIRSVFLFCLFFSLSSVFLLLFLSLSLSFLASVCVGGGVVNAVVGVGDPALATPGTRYIFL